jgi:hypothetical protein
MADVPQDISRLSPDKLALGFSRSKILMGIGIAVAVHVVFLLATSVTYIRDRWIDPEGAVKRKAAQIEARQAEEAKAAAASEKAAAAKRPAEAARPTAPDARSPEEARRDTPVMKGITELPKKGEIPKAPDGLGISIDETNR